MKKISLIIAAYLMLSCLCACKDAKVSSDDNSDSSVSSTVTTAEETTAETSSVEAEQKHYIVLSLDSKAIAQNLINENTEKEVYVYLPPSYYEGDKTYPVVYYLHGFGDPPGSFITSNRFALDRLFKDGKKEFIAVEINGLNKSGGSYYVNSPVIGNWEDYVVNEVIPLIDESYRTINDSNSRGICGFSMGGFGAFNLALLHPDIFGSMLTMSPGLIAEGDFQNVMNSWKNESQFKKAYGQAFSPNLNDTEDYCDEPNLTDPLNEDDPIVKNWINGYGNIEEKLDNYISLNKPLNKIEIVYGEVDSYKWIPNGCKYFSELLDDKGIEHTLKSFMGGHGTPPKAMEDYVVPFFNESLNY